MGEDRSSQAISLRVSHAAADAAELKPAVPGVGVGKQLGREGEALQLPHPRVPDTSKGLLTNQTKDFSLVINLNLQL